MYINKILMKFYHKSWFTHICRNFWKWQFHAFWGTFLNPQSLPGEHKGTFSCLLAGARPEGQLGDVGPGPGLVGQPLRPMTGFVGRFR